jgi:ketosteroid isomerase-like protein
MLASFVLLAFFSLSSGQVLKPAQANDDERTLRLLEDEWLSCYARGDKVTFDRIAADDFTSTDESATVRSKADEREIIQPPPPSIKFSLTNEEVRVRNYGDTAILTGRIMAKSQPASQAEVSFQTRFTDTFLKRAGRWRVAARHYSRIPPERTVVKLDPRVYDSYVGQYELAPNFVLTVTKEGDKLMSQGTGQPKFELMPDSEVSFFIRGFSAMFIFLRGESGEVNRLLNIQDGRLISAKRIR